MRHNSGHKRVAVAVIILMITGFMAVIPTNIFSAALELKQSAVKNIMVFMTNVTDHIAGQANETLDPFISKNGGAFAQAPAMSITDRGDGWYLIALNATDTGLVGPLVFHINAASSDPTDVIFEVVANIESDTASVVIANLDAASSTLALEASLISGVDNIVGADGDDLKGLSDQIDLTAIRTAQIAMDTNATAIKAQTDKFHFDASNNVRSVANATGINNQPAFRSEINSETANAISNAALATASALATVDSNVDAIKVSTDKFHFDVTNNVRAVINGAGVMNQPATVSENTTGVWNALSSNFLTVGSMGALLNSVPSNVWLNSSRTLTSITQTQGVEQNLVTVTDDDVVKVIRGDVKVLTFNLGSDWNLTGKKVYFIAKYLNTGDNADAIINRLATIVTATSGIANIALTTAETAVVRDHDAEIEIRDSDDTNPRTALQFTLSIKQDVRQ